MRLGSCPNQKWASTNERSIRKSAMPTIAAILKRQQLPLYQSCNICTTPYIKMKARQHPKHIFHKDRDAQYMVSTCSELILQNDQ